VPSSQQSIVPKDDEAINSDLDDSDTENEAEAEEGGAGDTDIVFCTYDKVYEMFFTSPFSCSCVSRLRVLRISGNVFSRTE
jgi:hypothetical protein